MQPRLKRSATESMVAGVSGGLAEYFNIDPVIVRLIFVLVTLTSGLGLPIYILLWIIMPQQSAASRQPFQQGAEQFSQEVSQFGQQVIKEAREFVVAQRSGSTQQPRVDAPFAPPPASVDYRFDPVTGQPLGPGDPATGQTVNLDSGAPQLPSAPYQQPAVPPMAPRRRNWNVLGLVLVGVGTLVMLEQLGINMSLVFPALLILAGVVLMRRKR